MSSKVLKLISPIPPSVNHYLGYRTVKKGGKYLAVSYKKPEAVKYQKNFKEYIIQQFYAHQTGILGTIIFHLLLAIFLLSMGIARLEVPLGTEIELAASSPQELEKILEEKQQRKRYRRCYALLRLTRMSARNRIKHRMYSLILMK